MKKGKPALTLISIFCFLILCACTGGTVDSSVEEAPSPQELTWREQYDLGVRYLSEGNYEEAIIAFTAAIEIDPKRAPAYVGRGDAYIGSGETEDNLASAKADYEKAIELNETNAEAYLGLADVYIRQGDYENALEILRQGLEKTNGNQRIEDKITEMDELVLQENSLWVLTSLVSYYGADGSLAEFNEYEYDEYGYLTCYSVKAPEFFLDEGKIFEKNLAYLYEYSEDSKVETTEPFWRSCISLYCNYIMGDESGPYDASMNLGTPINHSNGWEQKNGVGTVCHDALVDSNKHQEVKDTGRLSNNYSVGGNDPLEGYYALYIFDVYGNPVEISTYAPDGTLTGTAVLEWTCINPLPLP